MNKILDRALGFFVLLSLIIISVAMINAIMAPDLSDSVVYEEVATTPAPDGEQILLTATGIFLTAEALYKLNDDEASTQAFAGIIVKYQEIYSSLCPTKATPDTCRLAWELLDKYAVKRKVAPLEQGAET